MKYVEKEYIEDVAYWQYTLILVSIGHRKAKVLPEPVGAQAKHSRP